MVDHPDKEEAQSLLLTICENEREYIQMQTRIFSHSAKLIMSSFGSQGFEGVVIP